MLYFIMYSISISQISSKSFLKPIALVFTITVSELEKLDQIKVYKFIDVTVDLPGCRKYIFL